MPVLSTQLLLPYILPPLLVFWTSRTPHKPLEHDVMCKISGYTLVLLMHLTNINKMNVIRHLLHVGLEQEECECVPSLSARGLFLLPCDSYTEANESYLVSSLKQSHVLINKDTGKLGHIV